MGKRNKFPPLGKKNAKHAEKKYKKSLKEIEAFKTI